LMIGDDIYGDIEGALNSGMDAVLVKTGKYKKDDEHRLNQKVKTLDSILNFIN
ncbi:MAG: HAD hydrolase-like protein, partial [Saccharospirillaceae bacterium]|nr:HAD hydrolase-like protein [Saccharospirillaceae bacterium]